MIGIYKKYNKIITVLLILLFVFTAISCGKATKQTGTPTTTPATPTTQAPSDGSSTLSGYYITGTASVPKSYVTSYKIQTESISVTSSVDYPLSGAQIKVLEPITLADITKVYTNQTSINTDSKGVYNIPFLDSALGKAIVIESVLGDIRLLTSTTVPEKTTTTALKEMSSSKTVLLNVENTVINSIGMQIACDSLLGIGPLISSSIPSQYKEAFLIRVKNILNKIHANMTINPDPDSINIRASSTLELIRQIALAKAADIKLNQEVLALIEQLLTYTNKILELESITIPASCKNLNNYILCNIFGMQHSISPTLAKKLQGKTLNNINCIYEQNANAIGVTFSNNSRVTLMGNNKLAGSTLSGIANVKGENVDSKEAIWEYSELFIDENITDFELKGLVSSIKCDDNIKIGNGTKIQGAIKDHNNNYITNIYFIGDVEIVTGTNNTELLNFINALINKKHSSFSNYNSAITNVYYIIININDSDDDGDGGKSINIVGRNGRCAYWTTNGAVGPPWYILASLENNINSQIACSQIPTAYTSGSVYYGEPGSDWNGQIIPYTDQYEGVYIFISGSGAYSPGYWVEFDDDGGNGNYNCGNWNEVTIVLFGSGVFFSGGYWHVPFYGFHAQLQDGLGYEFKWYMFVAPNGDNAFRYPDSVGGWTTNQVPYFSSDPNDIGADATITWASGIEGHYTLKAEKKRNPDDEFIYQEIHVKPYEYSCSYGNMGPWNNVNIMLSGEGVYYSGGNQSWYVPKTGFKAYVTGTPDTTFQYHMFYTSGGQDLGKIFYPSNGGYTNDQEVTFFEHQLDWGPEDYEGDYCFKIIKNPKENGINRDIRVYAY